MKSKQSFIQRISSVLLSLFICQNVMFFTGCNKNYMTNNQTITNTQNEKSLKEIFSKANNEISADEINEYCSLSDFNKYNIKKDAYSRITTSINIAEIESDIGIPVLRKVDDIYYSVHCIKNDKGDKLYGFIMYRESGTAIDGWCTDELHTEDEFKNIKQGSNVSVVNKLDPYSCFFESENSATSYHTLANGKEYIVEYERQNPESDYRVVHSHSKNDTSNFTNLILNIDLNLISK